MDGENENDYMARRRRGANCSAVSLNGGGDESSHSSSFLFGEPKLLVMALILFLSCGHNTRHLFLGLMLEGP